MRFNSSNFDEPVILPASSFCESIFDGTHDSPKQQDYGFKLVTSRHIKANKILLEEAYFISEEDYLKINKRSRLQIGDVLFTMIGTVGEVCRVAIEPDFAIKNIGVFRPAESSDSAWIYYYLLSPEGRKSIDAAKRGTTQQFMGLKELREFPFIFPKDSRYRQKQMQILEQIDAKIETNRKISRTLEEIAQTIFKSWFIDFNPVKAKMAGDKSGGMDDKTSVLFPDSMKESELGLIPKGWKILPASDLFEIGIGRTPPRKEPHWFCNGNQGIPWVSIRDMGIYETYTHSTSEGLTEEAVAKFKVPVVPEETVLMSFKLTVGKLSITDRKLVTNEAIAHFKIPEESLLNTPFAYLWLKNLDVGSLDSTSSIGIATNSKVIKQIKFLVPAKELVDTFYSKVSPLFSQMNLLQKQIYNLTQIRDSLLPRLISGELKIPEEMLAS